MASIWRLRAALVLLARVVGVAGCTSAIACCDGDPPPVEMDAGPGGTPTLEIGTGPETFIPVDDGGMLELHRGCQGLQHVWIGLRTTRLGPTRNIVELSGVRVRDEFVVSMPFTARLSFTPDGDTASLAGLPLVFDDASSVVGEEIEVRSHVRDMAGVDVYATKRGRLVWGADICGVPDGGGKFDGTADASTPDAGTPPDGG